MSSIYITLKRQQRQKKGQFGLFPIATDRCLKSLLRRGASFTAVVKQPRSKEILFVLKFFYFNQLALPLPFEKKNGQQPVINQRVFFCGPVEYGGRIYLYRPTVPTVVSAVLPFRPLPRPILGPN